LIDQKLPTFSDLENKKPCKNRAFYFLNGASEGSN